MRILVFLRAGRGRIPVWSCYLMLLVVGMNVSARADSIDSAAATQPAGETNILLVGQEDLHFLADGMEAARRALSSLRCKVEARVEYENRDGLVRTQVTKWISSADRFKLLTEMEQTRNGQMVASEPGGGPEPYMVGEWASSGEITIMYDPDQALASIRRVGTGPLHLDVEHRLYDPLYYGLSIRGTSLKGILQGEPLSPPLAFPPQHVHVREKAVRYKGTAVYNGRQVHHVEIEWRWSPKAQPDLTPPNISILEIYIEPDRGFTVPRWALYYQPSGGARQGETSAETECVEYAPGVWGPRRTVFQQSRFSREVVTVADVRINEPVSDDELKVGLAVNVLVTDKVAGTIWRFANGGDQVQDQIERVSKIPEHADSVATGPVRPVAVPSAQSTPPRPRNESPFEYGTRYLIAGVAGLAFIAIVAMARKRNRARGTPRA